MTHLKGGGILDSDELDRTEEQKWLREVRDVVRQQGRVHNIAWDHCARLLKMLEEERACVIQENLNETPDWGKSDEWFLDRARRELYGDE